MRPQFYTHLNKKFGLKLISKLPAAAQVRTCITMRMYQCATSRFQSGYRCCQWLSLKAVDLYNQLQARSYIKNCISLLCLNTCYKTNSIFCRSLFYFQGTNYQHMVLFKRLITSRISNHLNILIYLYKQTVMHGYVVAACLY